MSESVKRMPRWPLVPIALPAAVAIWSGWVGLGALCGFGPVHVLPGISDLTINTAICLPIGMEAYAAYALAVWLRPEPVPKDARVFAKWSAGGALALGLLGQVAFHVLTSRGLVPAPVPVVVLVSCIPVAVVGLAAALVHLMSGEQEDARPGMVSSPSFTDAQTAALAMLERTTAAGNPLSQNKLMTQFRLSRAEAREVCELAERGRGNSSPNTGAAPATRRGRDGASPPGAPPSLLPAPAGAGDTLGGDTAPAGALNGRVRHG